MARYLLLIFSLLLTGSMVFAQTSLGGKVTDGETGEAIIFGTVAIYKNGVLVTGTDTDFDGNYSLSNIDPGTYEVEASFTGYQPARTTGVQVLAGKANKLDIKINSGGGVILDEVVVTEYKAPLIEQDNTTSGAVITSDQIRKLPTRNINALAATSAGLSSADEGDAISVRGSRDNATDYYVDGIRVQGDLIPESEIDQLQIITGGIEAQYGDVTGGVISITTKGPSSKFSGGIEAETSEYLDDFGNSLVGFNISGPLLKKSSGESILGFRLAGRYTYREDDDPNAVEVYRVKDDVLAELEANPIINISGSQLVAADFLTNDDVETLDAQPFEERERFDLTAKIDARLSSAIDVTFTGAVALEENQFTPNETSRTLANWRVLNSHNNPFQTDETYRGNFRFRHRLGGGVAQGDTEGAGKGALIQNASYILQFGYEKNFFDESDGRHEDNYFDYGYVGDFDIEWIPTFQEGFDPETGQLFLTHTDYRQVLRGYTPGAANPVLANYNNVLGLDFNDGINSTVPDYLVASIISGGSTGGDLVARTDFIAPNGQISPVFNNSWGYHTNVGTVYNRVRREDDDVYTFTATANFDLVPGGSDKGRHNIQLGVWYEQRSNRRYDVFPRNIWDVARQQANNHILGIPAENQDTIGTLDVPGYVPTTYLLDLQIDESGESQFFRRVRELTGQGLEEFVNVDGLNPDELSLDLFSARELNDQDILNYYGYDYLGNNFDGSFDDFFTERDPVTGIRTFPVAPNRPIYGAAYIQDKFTFKDIIFRVGVRVDRYDANTKVLKDNYSLYEIMGAGDFHSEFGGAQPTNVGDDFAVYLDEAGSEVQGYRDGDQWYFANGTPANNAALIFPGGLVNPKYADPRVESNLNFIRAEDFDTDAAFEDYEVQVNVMPRLAFSFPISTEANFFAHYDILVQRPPTNTIATARDYFYFFDEANIVKNNPNLRPERTIDYEVGFQQKLSNTSALKIAAYYKELRDMIQRRTFFPVPVIGQYTTFDNQDFGTVKGFTLQYDLRRTGNISLQANYTLQFADGTGSDADSQRGLTSRGNIRTLFPLNFDERHRLVAVLDFRYGKGKRYNGPRLFGSDIFSNAGINLQATAVSGRPYSATRTPLELGGAGREGALNGARKPWNYTVNLRVDKNFDIGNKLGLNVYVRVSNLLDRLNVIDVYSASGQPDDDGFLDSANGRDAIEQVESSLREVESFLDSYQWRVLNPNFYSLPRRIFVGAIFDF